MPVRPYLVQKRPQPLPLRSDLICVLLGYGHAEKSHLPNLTDQECGDGVVFGHLRFEWDQPLAHEAVESVDKLFERFSVQAHAAMLFLLLG